MNIIFIFLCFTYCVARTEMSVVSNSISGEVITDTRNICSLIYFNTSHSIENKMCLYLATGQVLEDTTMKDWKRPIVYSNSRETQLQNSLKLQMRIYCAAEIHVDLERYGTTCYTRMFNDGLIYRF